MAVPYLVFWLLLFLAREDLGIKGVAVSAAVWPILLLGFIITRTSPILFASATAILDVVLILVVFGEDIQIRRPARGTLGGVACRR